MSFCKNPAVSNELICQCLPQMLPSWKKWEIHCGCKLTHTFYPFLVPVKSCLTLLQRHGPQSTRLLSSPQSLEFAQTHVHRVGDAIQPSHPLSSPSPPAFNLSQHQHLFRGVSSLHQVAKGLEVQLQHQSFQWISGVDFLEDGLVGSPYSSRGLQESSPAPQFESISSLLNLLYSPALTSVYDKGLFNLYHDWYGVDQILVQLVSWNVSGDAIWPMQLSLSLCRQGSTFFQRGGSIVGFLGNLVPHRTSDEDGCGFHARMLQLMGKQMVGLRPSLGK